jgi:hypothetical protein
MPTLVATQITAKLATMLAGITVANGYSTGIGAEVRVGQLFGQADDAPMVYLTPGREQGGGAYGVAQTTRDYEVIGFVDARTSELDEHALVDTITWDIRRCLETYNAALAALGDIRFASARPGYREAAGSIVGAAVSYQIVYAVDVTAPTTAV